MLMRDFARRSAMDFRKMIRGRQFQKTWDNVKMTIICGFITILVLRGTIGGGGFGTPSQDFDGIKSHLVKRHTVTVNVKEVGRSLAQVRPPAEILQTHHRHQQPQQEQMHQASNNGSISDQALPPFSLGVKIHDWDEQRRLLMNTSRGILIMMVTGSKPGTCDNPSGDHYLLRSLKNKVDYGRLHDIQVFYNTAHMDDDQGGKLTGFWAKLPLLRRLMLSHPDVEWFWWIDSDAIITDMTFNLPLESYTKHNLILHGWDSEVYERRNWLGLNTGSFLLRNCQWSLDILDAWAPIGGPQGTIRIEAGKILTKYLLGRPDFEADDQSALVYLLSQNTSTWRTKVYLENAYYLHGYWVMIVDRYEANMRENHSGFGDERWPFVTHFVGCKPCGKFGDYPVEKCNRGMDRALNFADNQILEKYGFRHKNLDTNDVEQAS